MIEDVHERVDWVARRAALMEVNPHRRVSALGGEATGHYVMRFGTAFLTGRRKEEGGDDRDPDKVWEAVARALRADSRVVKVGGTLPTKAWSLRRKVFPVARRTGREFLLGGHDLLPNLRFSSPMYFQLHVPRKNQPTVYDWTDVPTEDYWVVWDGVSILVLWECGADQVHPPNGGGNIAFDVLSEATKAAGADLMVQACSPSCRNKFSHTKVRIVQLPKEAQIELHGIGGKVAVAVLSVGGGPEEVLNKLGSRLLDPGSEFAQMKNFARRVLDMEREAELLVSELLLADYNRLDRQSNRWKRHLSRRDYRRIAKRNVASLWLVMSGIQMLRAQWDLARLEFDNLAGRQGMGIYFDLDRQDDDNQVKAINLDFVRAVVEQQSSRIDNRLTATVTAAGGAAAVVGGVAGAVVGGVLFGG